MQTKNRKKIVVYSHDTFGLGNVRRMLAITEHLLDTMPNLSVLLISGSPMIHSFRLPESRFDYLKLPTIGRTLSGEYIAKKLETNFDELVTVRSQIIQAAIANFSPDVMIVDKKPRGVADELQPALELIHRDMPLTKVVLLLRDILDDPKITHQIWLKNNYFQSINRHYDSILVMGSIKVFDLAKEYRFPENIAKKVTYCGYINRNHIVAENNKPGLSSKINRTDVLVTVGGGEDGMFPLKCFLNGLALKNTYRSLSTTIVTGPEMSGQHRNEIQQMANSFPNVNVLDFVAELPAHIFASELIVSMGGYNTVVEILALNKPVIVIPRVKPVLEQLIRAIRMEKMGLLHCIHPDEISPKLLMQAVTSQLEKRQKKFNAAEIIDFNGLGTATRTIEKMMVQGTENIVKQIWPKKTLKSANNQEVKTCSAFL
jgi:predicted glycosyltransferase